MHSVVGSTHNAMFALSHPNYARSHTESSGCPSLPMAHSRRAENTYDEHIEDCFDNRRSVSEEEQRSLQEEIDREKTGVADTEAQKKPMFEAFALRCRWGRVDCLVGEGIVGILCGHIAVGAALKATESQHDHKDKDKGGASGLALQAASISLEILHSICRLCDKDQITSVTLQIMKIWQPCKALLEDSDQSFAHNQRGWLCCGWWKVIAEICRRSREFALWLCEPGSDNIISKCLILILRSADEVSPREDATDLDPAARRTDSTDSSWNNQRSVIVSQRQSWNTSVWAMRVWRVCTVYGQGARNISELLLAAQLERCFLAGASAGASRAVSGSRSSSERFVECMARAVGPGMATRLSSSRRLTEVMWLLEQSAVSCAALINTHTTKQLQLHSVWRDAASRARSGSESTSSTPHAATTVDRQNELKEEEAVGIALETARLLLGVAEGLLPSVLSWSRLEGSSNSLHSLVDVDTRLLFSASAHFLSSLLGSWQGSEATKTRWLAIPAQPSVLRALNDLEGYSLRQHQLPKLKSEPDIGLGPGLGLLQSCVQYAAYVRTASCQENQATDGEDKGKEEAIEKGSRDASASGGDDTSCVQTEDKSQFQFAALHHLESKINFFVDHNISHALLSSLESMISSQPGAGADDTTVGDSYLSWIAKESNLAVIRLFSNVLSYVRIKPTPDGKALSLCLNLSVPFALIVITYSTPLLSLSDCSLCMIGLLAT